MYPQNHLSYGDPAGAPAVMAQAGYALQSFKTGGPLPAAASWLCAHDGYVIDMAGPVLGFWNQAWWNEVGDPDDALHSYPAFFMTSSGVFPQNDLVALEPAIRGTWDDGEEIGQLVAIGYSIWDADLNLFRVGWRSPLGFFEQRPDGAILHPGTGEVIGEGTWYHRA